MKVIVAIDSFKGSLSSMEAGMAIKDGIHRVDSSIEVIVRPLADGGEGTVEALCTGLNGSMQSVTVTGPLGAPVEAVYGILPQSHTAVIEMSAAAGITLITPEERNPLYTTTFGVGELIKDAIQKGCRSFIVGIGGSATNDGGIGMLQALGFELLDCEGKQVSFGAQGLKNLCRINCEHALPELKECTFKVACDVANPLCGPQGCSAVFGPQKGATPDMIRDMDFWLSSYASLTKAVLPASDYTVPGTGAAGGMGFAFLSYLHATLESGIQIILDETHLEDLIKDADYVITGEGRLDSQTVMGKAPIGVAKLAKKHKKKVIAFSGCVTPDATACNEHGIDAFFPILREVTTLSEAMDPVNARNNLIATVEQVFRLITL